jgi:predicted nuclease of predicted toxin-antitoxin system
MRFLVDAQLPKRLALSMRTQSHDVIHTLDLPQGNSTTDSAITALADQEERVVVTKDADFVHSFLIQGKPHKLLLISTGNISNSNLEAILIPQLPAIVEAFAEHRFVEITRDRMIIHV